MKTEDIRLQLRADPDLLRSVRAMLGCYARSRGFPETRAEEIVLAVDEACTNAIRHSYGGPCDEKLELRMGTAEGGLEITLSDGGRPCPKAAIVRKGDPPPDPDVLKPGGLGVQLMFRVFDEVDFQPGEEKGNRVRLFLRWPEPAAEKGGPR